jgi:hypothetical protein
MTLQIFLDAYVSACARANTAPLQSVLRWTTVRLAPGPVTGATATAHSQGLASPGGASSVGSQQLFNTRGQLTPITDRDFANAAAAPMAAMPDHAMPTPAALVPGTPSLGSVSGSPSAARFLSQSQSTQSPQSPQSPSGSAAGAAQVGVITLDISTDLVQGAVREQDVHVLGDAIATTLAPFTGVSGTSLRRMGHGISTNQLPPGLVAEIIAVPTASDAGTPVSLESGPLLLANLYRMLAAPESPVFSIAAPFRLMPTEYTAAMATNAGVSAFAFNPIESGTSSVARHHAVALLRAARPQSLVAVASSAATPMVGVALSGPAGSAGGVTTPKPVGSLAGTAGGDVWVMRKNMLVQALPQLHSCLAVPDDLR